jgi:uncharacterized protein involved in response to NO
MRSLPLAGAAPEPRTHEAVVPSGLAASGFRPFFLAAALFAALAVPMWLLVMNGSISVGGGYLQPMSWHAHEMVFGYSSAVVAGFLLTAVKNWTGRETATGGALLALAFLWLLGRVVLALGSRLPLSLVAIIDLAFLPAVALTIGRPIIAAGNKRNYVMLAVLGALFAANASVHLDALGVLEGFQLRGSHAGVGIIVLLAAIIAGRVIPMFTRNATGSKAVVSVKALDVAALAAIALHSVLDVASPFSWPAGVTALVAAGLVVARSARWGSVAALRHPLLWILHFGHGWIAVGLALRAASIAFPSIPASAGTHALTVGAIGSLTLGMMARVSLGHTGRPLVATPITVVAFALVTLAACLRVFGPLVGGVSVSYLTWLAVSGALWSCAFALYVAAYAKILVSPRADGKPG